VRFLLSLIALCVLASTATAQPVVRTVFPPEEYAARREKLFARIGDGIAIIQGTTERPGEQPFRQANQFSYLTGVAEPRAIALLDGKTHETSVFLLPKRASDVDSKYGPGALYPSEETARTLGVTRALPRDALTGILAGYARESRTIYTPFRPEVLGSASPGDTRALARANHNDPWDGRISREDAFRGHLMELAPTSDIRDLDPLIDDLRAIKSPREIEVLREATRITDRGILRAMHAAKPGIAEYRLQAESEYEFKKAGAYGAAYFALIATGQNTWYTHYHYNTAILKDGDLVQYDYAPDYRGYASDVTRIFPANGKFTAEQREYYTLYLRLYQAMMTSIRPHETHQAISARADARMKEIVAGHTFASPTVKAAFEAMIADKPPVPWIGHAVGLEVHDTYGSYKTLEPGMVLTIEPQFRLPAQHLGLRLEDMILITDTGYEILSNDLPIEAKDIEREMSRPLPAALR
jgi:Xaa-Pro aminopeptidase